MKNSAEMFVNLSYTIDRKDKARKAFCTGSDHLFLSTVRLGEGVQQTLGEKGMGLRVFPFAGISK